MIWSDNTVPGLKRRLNYKRRPDHFPYPINTMLADETKDRTLLSSWTCCCTLTCTMRLPVCMPMNISALSSQVSFFDILSCCEGGYMWYVKIGNITAAMLPLSIGMKMDTTTEGHSECVCVWGGYSICVHLRVIIFLCCSLSKMIWCLFTSCFLLFSFSLHFSLQTKEIRLHNILVIWDEIRVSLGSHRVIN